MQITYEDGECMIINIKYWKNNVGKRHIVKAVNIINGLQNYYNLILKPLEKDIVDEASVIWDSFRKSSPVIEDEYAIFITDKAFDDNWFSHEEDQFSVITISDWERYFAPPSLKAYLVYQIAQAAICFAGGLSETVEMRMIHDDAAGCMFDFCMDKEDIHLGMIAGNICPQCRTVLVQYGINEKAIYSVERMLSYVRSEAIGKPMLFNENEAFVVMRFSQNDENEHAYLYGIKPALESLNINSIRADNQMRSGQLLNKIEIDIKRSRFVIVKVDEDNLNVYFELGLAMGLDKDIILISERNLVLNLPTDLRNWECLTYTEGNYEELRNNLVNFFVNNYHYTIT